MTGTNGRVSLPEAELDRVMERIRAEIAARKAPRDAAPAAIREATSSNSARPSLPRFEGSPALERKSVYVLDDFLRYHDEEFLRYAYRRILGREPDRAGAEIYLRRLRSGDMGKADVLMALRFSPEGRIRSVPVEGLGTRRMISYRLRRLTVVGYLIDIVNGIVRLPRHMQALRRVENFAAANHQQVRHVVDSLARRAEEDLHGLRDAMEALRSHNESTDVRLEAVRLANTAMSQRLDSYEQRVDSSERAIGELRTVGQVTETRLRGLEAELAGCRRGIVQLERALASTAVEAGSRAPQAATRESEIAGFDRFYADFEDRFRGTREDITNRQRVYLPYLTGQSRESLGDLPAIDLGCGRGEWLELLAAQGIPARGIDTNKTFLDDNRARGLEVVEADAIEYLVGLTEGSVRAITGFHIIEHLPFGKLVSLVDESLQVLADGGVAIFETPNPENLVTAACNFHYDPTHIRPIPPDLAAHLLRARGFTRVEILRLHEAQLPESESIESPTLRRLLFGPQDYAVIGFK